METAAILVLSLAATSGCALTLDGPKAQRTRIEVPRCDTGKGLVALDGVFAGLFGIGAAAALTAEDSLVGVSATGLALAFLGSAISGNRRVDRCRAAYGEYEAAIGYRPPRAASGPAIDIGSVRPAISTPLPDDESADANRDADDVDAADPWRDFWTVSP